MNNKQKNLQKKKLAYQKELLRKPKKSREFMRALLTVLSILVILDLLLTIACSKSYINSAQDVLDNMEMAMDSNLTELETINNSFDFNNVKVSDDYVLSDNDGFIHDFSWLIWRSDFDSSTKSPQTTLLMIRDAYNAAKHSFTNSMDSYNTYNSYYSLFNKNGEKLYTQDTHILSILVDKNVKNKSKHNTVYMLDTKAIDTAYPGLINELIEKTTVANPREYATLSFEDIYVNGLYEIPKKITVIMRQTSDGQESNVETYDLSKCDFTGFEPIQSDENIKIFNPIIYNIGIEESSHKKLYDSYSHDQMNEYIHSLNKDNTSLEDIKKSTLFSYRETRFRLCSNESLVLMTSLDFNFLRDFKGLLILFYLITLLLSVLIAFIISRVRYNKKSIAYEIDSYRRKTTNAMAHDLKSPLMAISGYAENIANSPDSKTAKQFAGSILDTVKEMDNMIVNILDLAKIEDTSFELKCEETNIRKQIEELVRKQEVTLDECQMSVVISGDATVNYDSKWFAHLYNNLLSNAIQYGRRDSEITVDISQRAFIMKNVFDGTIDVDAAELTKAFVKGDTARNHPTGNGLGLSIANHIALAHGYKFTVSVDDGVFTATVTF